MTNSQTLGAAMLALVVLGLALYAARRIGVRETLITFAIAFGATAFILAGVLLATGHLELP